MPWPIYLALKQLFPTGKRVHFFTVISVCGVALGVALLVVTISVMGGFGQEIRRMIIETGGDIQIRSSAAIRNPEQVIADVKALPGVSAATPFAEGVVMVLAGNRPAFPAVQGVDVERVNGVIPLDRYIRWGSLDALDDDSIIVSAQLAQQLDASVGGKIELYTPLMLERMRADEAILPREFRVAGLFEIGHNQLDSSVVICTLRTMQDLYGLGGSVHGISVKLAPGADEDRVAAAINKVLPPNMRALTWLETNRDFLFIIRLEKNLLFFLLLFIVVVAAFSVASSLLISVVRKTKEIGLIGALGGDSRGVALCFCFQGLFVGITGTLLGTAFGFVAVWLRNDIVQLFARVTQSREALVRFYQFTNIPAHIPAGDLITILASSIIISTLAALLPAWRAARLKPSEALRSE